MLQANKTQTKKIMMITIIASLLLLTFISINTSEAHVLIVGDSRSDLPDTYEHAVEANEELQSEGYDTLLLTRKSATTENIIKGMKDADAVIYIGHGTTAGEKTDGTTKAPYGICGSNGIIWAVGNKLSLSSSGTNSFVSPTKPTATFIAVHTCYSFGRAGNKLYKNPYESTYAFSAPYVSRGGNYFATSYCSGFLKLLDDGGSRTFAQAWNKMNVQGQWTPKKVNGRNIYLTTGQSFGSYWDAYVGTGMNTVILPKAANVQAYSATAANNWYKTVPANPASIKRADLVVTKIVKKGRYYVITVKNQGTATSAKTTLRMVYKKKVRTATVKALAKGKSTTIKIATRYFGKYAKKRYTKMVTVDYKNKVKELNEKNNKRGIRA